MSPYPVWKKAQINEGRKSLISIFLTIILLFALFNGLTRGISLGQKLKSSWDGKGSIVAAITTANPALFIYQVDSKKVRILALGEKTVYESGQAGRPLEMLREKIDAGPGLSRAMSKAFGAKIENYVELAGKGTMDQAGAQNLFKNFASVTTPFKILTTGYKSNISNTNITRITALRLWWQLKGLSTKDVVFKDLSTVNEEVLDKNAQKVLGADTAGLNREISNYLLNANLASEHFNITIVNKSGWPFAAKLANYFVASLGGKVVSLETGETTMGKTLLTTTDGHAYSTSYLAKMFECDINIAQNSQNPGEITIELGEDFAKNWLE